MIIVDSSHFQQGPYLKAIGVLSKLPVVNLNIRESNPPYKFRKLTVCVMIAMKALKWSTISVEASDLGIVSTSLRNSNRHCSQPSPNGSHSHFCTYFIEHKGRNCLTLVSLIASQSGDSRRLLMLANASLRCSVIAPSSSYLILRLSF
jgi:hypothetical protein